MYVETRHRRRERLVHLYSHVQACRALECELLAVVGTASVVVFLTDSRCVCVSVIETERV